MSYFDILVLLVFRPWRDCGFEVHLEPFSRKNQVPSNDPSIKKSNFGIFRCFWSKMAFCVLLESSLYQLFSGMIEQLAATTSKPKGEGF